jgi:hypothetical protein
MLDQNERTYQDAEPRAGGDVVTKSASQSPDKGEPIGGKRAGGDVVTKGPSQQPPSGDAGIGGKRAGGDVVTKGPSQSS